MLPNPLPAYFHADTSTFVRSMRTLLRPENLAPRRLAAIATMVGGAMVPHAVLSAGFRLLDDVVLPEYRDTEVRDPIFIVSNPRSGTTLLHHLLSLDEERFETLALWHTIFSAASFYRLVGALAEADKRTGGFLQKAVRFVEHKAFGGWDDIHKMGFARTEEDEAIFFSMWATPALGMMVPFPEIYSDLEIYDHLPERVRAPLKENYRSFLQRHMFATDPSKQFLGKNVFSSGRVRTLLETFPDARFVQIVRHPYDALPSFCSMFSTPWKFHSPDVVRERPDQVAYWAQIGVRFYRYLLELRDELPPDVFVTVRYDDLIADPVATVESIYEQLGMPVSPAFKQRVVDHAAKMKRFKSKHSYSLEEFGLTRDWIRQELADVFEAYDFDPDRDDDDDSDAAE